MYVCVVCVCVGGVDVGDTDEEKEEECRWLVGWILLIVCRLLLQATSVASKTLDSLLGCQLGYGIVVPQQSDTFCLTHHLT